MPARDSFSLRLGPFLAVLDLGVAAASAPFLLFWYRWPDVAPLAAALLLVPRAAHLLARGWAAVRTPLDGPVVLVLVMLSVGRLVSVDARLSNHKFYGLLLGIAVYYAVVHSVSALRSAEWGIGAGRHDGRGLLAAASVFVAGGTAIALLALVGTEWRLGKVAALAEVYQWLPRLITEVQASTRRLDGFDANQVGGTLVLVLPVAAALALGGKRSGAQVLRRSASPAATDDLTPETEHRVAPPPSHRRSFALWLAAAGAAVLMAGVVLLTVSRSAYVGAVAGLAALLLLRWPRLVWGVPVVVGVGGMGVWLVGPGKVLNALLAVDTAGVAGSGTWESRAEIWLRALYMLQDFPFTGIGLNTFPVVADTLYPLFLHGPDARLPHAHNLFFQTAVDFGLPGLMAFLWLIGIVAHCLWRAWLPSPVPEAPGQLGTSAVDTRAGTCVPCREFVGSRVLVAGVAAGLLAHGVFSLTDAVTLGAKPGFLLWWAFALAVLAQRAAGEARAAAGYSGPADGPGARGKQAPHQDLR